MVKALILIPHVLATTAEAIHLGTSPLLHREVFEITSAIEM
jgi:hypothetical protein